MVERGDEKSVVRTLTRYLLRILFARLRNSMLTRRDLPRQIWWWSTGRRRRMEGEWHWRKKGRGIPSAFDHPAG
jgi:hypothetical protein